MPTLRITQKAALGKVITDNDLAPRDFDWADKPDSAFGNSRNPARIFYKQNPDHYFQFEYSTSKAGKVSIYVMYAPAKEESRQLDVAMSWNDLLIIFNHWIGIVKEEVEAVDPWADPPESETFTDDNSKFGAAELVQVDKAVDAAFATLIKEAVAQGVDASLEDVKKDIKYLKAEARKQGRNKWLDIFKRVIASKVAEWGLEAAIGAAVNSAVLQTLYETAKPLLSLVAGIPPH